MANVVTEPRKTRFFKKKGCVDAAKARAPTIIGM